jgi:hypothetical protein
MPRTAWRHFEILPPRCSIDFPGHTLFTVGGDGVRVLADIRVLLMKNAHRTFKSAEKQCCRERQHQVAEEFPRRSNILTGRDSGIHDCIPALDMVSGRRWCEWEQPNYTTWRFAEGEDDEWMFGDPVVFLLSA